MPSRLPPKSPLPVCRATARLCVIAALFFAVSGAPAFIVQGIAWCRMAQHNGGLRGLPDAVFSAAPCNLCCAAQKLAHKAGENPKAPAPNERSENVNTRLIATVARRIALPRFQACEITARHHLHLSEVSAASRRDRPPTPPPRQFLS